MKTELRRRARRCRGCGTLLFASQDCGPCDTATVHVITDLGATGGPGRLVYARLTPPSPRRPRRSDDRYRFTKAYP